VTGGNVNGRTQRKPLERSSMHLKHRVLAMTMSGWVMSDITPPKSEIPKMEGWSQQKPGHGGKPARDGTDFRPVRASDFPKK
jgi:hypothetical protein